MFIIGVNCGDYTLHYTRLNQTILLNVSTTTTATTTSTRTSVAKIKAVTAWCGMSNLEITICIVNFFTTQFERDLS